MIVRFQVPGIPQGCVPIKRPAIVRLHDGYDVIGECWVWRGAKDRKGYARFRNDEGRTVSVHRFAYESLKGAIPSGLVIDHLCRNPGCCNPDHLEPVTNAENIRRGRQGEPQRQRTHCPKGHPYSPDNTVSYRPNERLCRTCQRANWKVQDRRKAELRKASR